jgi:hypothetical protein
MDTQEEPRDSVLMLRIDCTQPGCSRCVAQIVFECGRPAILRFRARHSGHTHDVELPLAEIVTVLKAAEAQVRNDSRAGHIRDDMPESRGSAHPSTA